MHYIYIHIHTHIYIYSCIFFMLMLLFVFMCMQLFLKLRAPKKPPALGSHRTTRFQSTVLQGSIRIPLRVL